MPTARSQNKQKRRQRILLESRKIIAEKGFDGLNLRDLAELSELTVPTIYNLIGGKNELLMALTLGAFADFETLMENREPVPIAKMPEQMFDTLVELITQDENYYRATLLATDRLEDQREIRGEQGFQRAPLRLICARLCSDALEQGLLRGDIDTNVLAEQMVSNHRLSLGDWAHRAMSLQDYRIRSLQGCYVVLAADAIDSFRDEIVRQLAGL